jgi:hypothetical protein
MWFDSRRGLGILLFETMSRPVLGANPDPYQMGTRGPFAGRKAGHSPLSVVEVKEWVELYLHSPVRLHGVVRA